MALGLAAAPSAAARSAVLLRVRAGSAPVRGAATAASLLRGTDRPPAGSPRPARGPSGDRPTGAFPPPDGELHRPADGPGKGRCPSFSPAPAHDAGARELTLDATTAAWPSRPAEPGRPAPPPVQSRRRVLVVDDNADAADSLAEVLRLHGHLVQVAYDGRSALALLGAVAPDAVVCDLGLPGMSGLEVATAIRAGGDEGVLLLALTARTQPGDVRGALEAGFDAHLVKPVDVDELLRLLARGRG